MELILRQHFGYVSLYGPHFDHTWRHPLDKASEIQEVKENPEGVELLPDQRGSLSFCGRSRQKFLNIEMSHLQQFCRVKES